VEGHFALSWILTLFAHVVEDLPAISRLFDVLLASHPLFPLYLTVAMVAAHRTRVLAVPCEYSAVYKTLNGLAGHVGDFEPLFAQARLYLRDVPPSTLLTLPGLSRDTLALLGESDLPDLAARWTAAQRDPVANTARLRHPPISTTSAPATTRGKDVGARWTATITRERVAYAVGTVVWAASLAFASDLASLLASAAS
jgi:hypothetical protein